MMGLNKQKGNMYPWVTHTFNIIKGKCPHDCTYCYMKGYPQPELHFDESEFNTDLGEGKVIFVGSSCDMWALPISTYQIKKILAFCRLFPNNRYLFQSKACWRFISSQFSLPNNTILGTTIESNRDFRGISKAPNPWERMVAMTYIEDYPKMVSIEPVMDFDLIILAGWIKAIKPEFVSIGADSKGHHLPEPSADKIAGLIEELKKITEVKVKDNLNRILNQEERHD